VIALKSFPQHDDTIERTPKQPVSKRLVMKFKKPNLASANTPETKTARGPILENHGMPFSLQISFFFYRKWHAIIFKNRAPVSKQPTLIMPTFKTSQRQIAYFVNVNWLILGVLTLAKLNFGLFETG
jgi:uncharacterized membrane protein